MCKSLQLELRVVVAVDADADLSLALEEARTVQVTAQVVEAGHSPSQEVLIDQAAFQVIEALPSSSRHRIRVVLKAVMKELKAYLSSA